MLNSKVTFEQGYKIIFVPNNDAEIIVFTVVKKAPSPWKNTSNLFMQIRSSTGVRKFLKNK